MQVCRAYRVVDSTLVADEPIPSRFGFTVGDVVGQLMSIGHVEGATVAWSIEVLLADEKERHYIAMPIEPLLFPDEQDASSRTPISVHELRTVRATLASTPLDLEPGRWLWLFRDGLYVTERPVRDAEIEEVLLAIKASHYRSDSRLKRLAAEVATFEALDAVRRDATNRRALRDDVKLFVWARDGGRCVRCHADTELHFDHIIPLSKGGSDEAENIQLLCRSCNLSKSDRIA